MTLKEAAPAEIVLQVLSGDAVEVAHPSLQAAVVGIDVLDVEDAVQHSQSLLHVDRAVGDSSFASEGLIDGCTV